MPRIALAAAALLFPALALPAQTAGAVLRDAKGEKVGVALLVEEAAGLTLSVKVSGLAPGKHGLHLHAVGKCEAPDFQSAGPHFNPAGKKHGLKSPEGHHLGDLPNLEVGPDGKGEAKQTVKGATLDAGPGGLFGPLGTSVVVHEKPDDETTDPGGGSGARIACGPVARGE
jgi:superoxide dismutase, Cu-Zn family